MEKLIAFYPHELHSNPVSSIRKRSGGYKKALRMNDRLVMWAVDLITRRTQTDIRKSYTGQDPLA